MSQLFGAIDLGASSGRVIVGQFLDGNLQVNELHRFRNIQISEGNRLYWDLENLHTEIQRGLNKLGSFAENQGSEIVSIGIDTWAVDFGLIDQSGAVIGGVRHYRDERNKNGVAAVHQIVEPADLFAQSGLQFLPFNTIYQLATVAIQDPNDLQKASSLLLIPDLIAHWLTGEIATERTNASTTGLLSIETREWNWPLIDKLQLPRTLFTRLIDPGETIGKLRSKFRTSPALANTKVVSVPSHDTASAVAGTPLMERSSTAYLSSGTWSLLGLELDEPNVSEGARRENFTNELGAQNRVRFLKNISGLWLIQQLMVDFKQQDPSLELATVLEQASHIVSDARISVEDEEFAKPGGMTLKIQASCTLAGLDAPTSPAELVRCILDSLADCYAVALTALEKVSGVSIKQLHVVGGGSQNDLLSQLTSDRTGLPVMAGPAEATAIGNLMCQASAYGVVGESLEEQRVIIERSYKSKSFLPRPSHVEVVS